MFSRHFPISLFLFHLFTTTIASRQQWTALSPLPIPRQEHSTVALNNNTIAVVGGVTPVGNSTYQSGLQTTDLVQLYDITSNKWRTVSPIPYKVNHPNVAVVNGKIYILGGLVDAPIPSNPILDWIASGESHVYDPTTDSWQRLESMPPGTERGSAIVGVRGAMIYLAGGMTYLLPGEQDAISTVTAFNTTSAKWQRLPAHAANIPEGRQHGVSAVIGNTFYVVGGRWFEKTNVRDTVFTLNLDSLESGWKTSKSRMPSARGGLAGAAVGNRIYTFGGEANPNAENGVFKETEVFNTKKGGWEKLASMKVPRHGTSAVAVGGKVYVPGGGLQEDGLPVVRGGVEWYFETTGHFDVFDGGV